MKSTGTILAATMLWLAAGCATPDWIDRTLVTVDVTGLWYGAIQGTGAASNREFTMELKQRGAKVTGTLRARFATSFAAGPISGSVTGDRFEFVTETGVLHGELIVSGDEMTGRSHGPLLEGLLTLRRATASSDPTDPPSKQ